MIGLDVKQDFAKHNRIFVDNYPHFRGTLRLRLGSMV